MTTESTLDYFETDLLKHAVALWKLARGGGEPDFDVLRFARDWTYAEAVLAMCLASTNDVVSDGALQLMQLRTRFEQQYPERARRIGAPGADMTNTATSGAKSLPPARPGIAAPTDKQPSSDAPDVPGAPPRYLKSLR